MHVTIEASFFWTSRIVFQGKPKIALLDETPLYKVNDDNFESGYIYIYCTVWRRTVGPGMLIKLVAKGSTQFRQSMQPLTGPYFGLSRKDILELPLQEELFHTHLLDCLDFENYVIIASFGFDVGHDGKVSLSSAEGLQDELEVDGREPKRRWRPGTVSIFKQLATMTAVEFASHQSEYFAMQ